MVGLDFDWLIQERAFHAQKICRRYQISIRFVASIVASIQFHCLVTTVYINILSSDAKMVCYRVPSRLEDVWSWIHHSTTEGRKPHTPPRIQETKIDRQVFKSAEFSSFLNPSWAVIFLKAVAYTRIQYQLEVSIIAVLVFRVHVDNVRLAYRRLARLADSILER